MKQIFISLGDPRGISASIIVRSLVEIKNVLLEKEIQTIIIADASLINAELDKLDERINISDFKGVYARGIYVLDMRPSGDPGKDSLSYVDKAIDLCQTNPGSSMVTGPVIKKDIAFVEKGFKGHTEYIAEKTSSRTPVMSFWSRDINFSLLTTHVPLSDVAKLIDEEKIIGHVRVVWAHLRHCCNTENPGLVLCGLNPHAGENGEIGQEEKLIFVPAVRKLRAECIDVSGPLSAEAALERVLNKKTDFLVTCFHDQVLPVLKNLKQPLVNITLGLPFLRTSPSHGPALGIRKPEMADYSSMLTAIKYACGIERMV